MTVALTISMVMYLPVLGKAFCILINCYETFKEMRRIQLKLSQRFAKTNPAYQKCLVVLNLA